MKTKKEIDKVIKQKIKKLKSTNIDNGNKKEIELLSSIHRVLSNKFETVFDKISFEAAMGILKMAGVKDEDLANTYASLLKEEKSFRYTLFSHKKEDLDQERD